ncbi:MAG: efflux transporter periplasmic adaptor subunit [Bacteroidetes bacterium]|nr:efflux transporter periplasmic adaptor subunit [Bacteroidota bacterium]
MNSPTIILKKFSCIIMILLIIFSCGKKKPQAYTPLEIPVVKVIQQDIPIYQDFIGQIYGQFDIPIRARVSGFLDAIHFQEGYWVKKGQLLYTIDPQPLEANLAGEMSRLAEKKTELAKAESDLGRIVPLAKINAVSKSDLDATQAQYNAAKANVKAVESSVRIANINLSYCWIKSPISGLIGKTQAKVGEFVGQDPNPVILNTVSTIDTVHVEFYLVEADYLGLARKFIESSRQKEDADYIEREATRDSELTLILSDGSIFNHKGHVNFIDRQVNPETGSLLIQTSFPNPDQLLRPGQYAKVRAKMDVLKDAIMIPQRCVMELQGTHSVYIVNDSSIVKSRQIVTGSKYEDYWIINKGLKANDKVVINALQKVAPGMPVIPKITDFENKTTTQ